MAFLLPSWLDRLPELTAAAVLDILVLALVIYQILLLIQGTRATQVVVGIAVLAAAYYVARWGQLQTVEWLLDHLFPYLIIGLIVLFQNEIRRGLARMGRNPFRTRFSSFKVRQALEDILMAVSLFSAQKIGALIVLERETGLRTYAESGIPLNAQLSYDLLIAIFQPHAPLHDGAVILRQDKIVAAACFLPLSINPIWGTQLGTRHRAAVGITEETDAVSLAVSEETGAISLAVSGSIELNLSPDRLAERLGEIFEHPLPPAAPLLTRLPSLEEASATHPANRPAQNRL